jgi:hypothetical protein
MGVATPGVASEAPPGAHGSHLRRRHDRASKGEDRDDVTFEFWLAEMIDWGRYWRVYEDDE